MSSITRVADVITAMSRQDGVRMLTGVTSGTAGDVTVGGSTFRVAHWVNRPTVTGQRVVLLMQGGSGIAIGLD